MPTMQRMNGIPNVSILCEVYRLPDAYDKLNNLHNVVPVGMKYVILTEILLWPREKLAECLSSDC